MQSARHSMLSVHRVCSVQQMHVQCSAIMQSARHSMLSVHRVCSEYQQKKNATCRDDCGVLLLGVAYKLNQSFMGMTSPIPPLSPSFFHQFTSSLVNFLVLIMASPIPTLSPSFFHQFIPTSPEIFSPKIFFRVLLH